MKIQDILETAKNTGAALREKAVAAGQAAFDGTLQTIEKWLEEFPKIESYGLQVANFAFTMGLSPSLEVELKGNRADFPADRLAKIIAENKSGSLTGMVFSAIRTAYKLHAKIAQTPDEVLFVKIRLSLSPEISVYIGKPRIL